MDLLDELEPLWLSMFDHHVEVGAAGLPVIERSRSWGHRRALYLQLLAEPDTFVLVARRGGRAVGYALVHVHEGADDTWPTGDRIGEVESLAVLPEERGGGIGTLLLDTADEHLARLGIHDLLISVLAGNDDALRFYRRRGLRPVATRLLRLGHPDS